MRVWDTPYMHIYDLSNIDLCTIAPVRFILCLPLTYILVSTSPSCLIEQLQDEIIIKPSTLISS